MFLSGFLLVSLHSETLQECKIGKKGGKYKKKYNLQINNFIY